MLRRRLRDGDIAARFGGDEFVVLLPHTDIHEAEQIAASLTHVYATTNVRSGTDELPVSVSIGAAEIPAGARGIELVLAEADRSMYAVKRERRRAR